MRWVFWGVFAAGFVACSTIGIGPALRRAGGSWTSPAMLAGMVLGCALLALAAAFATGMRPAVLASDRAMVTALGALIGLKVAVGAAQMAVGVFGKG
jgi:hypothetical protein